MYEIRIKKHQVKLNLISKKNHKQLQIRYLHPILKNIGCEKNRKLIFFLNKIDPI